MAFTTDKRHNGVKGDEALYNQAMEVLDAHKKTMSRYFLFWQSTRGFFPLGLEGYRTQVDALKAYGWQRIGQGAFDVHLIGKLENGVFYRCDIVTSYEDYKTTKTLEKTTEAISNIDLKGYTEQAQAEFLTNTKRS